MLSIRARLLREGFHEAILVGFFLWRGVFSTSILIWDPYVGGLTLDFCNKNLSSIHWGGLDWADLVKDISGRRASGDTMTGI